MVYASRHGTASPPARRARATVESRRVDAVETLDGDDAVVFGAPVYDQAWPPEAEAFVAANREALSSRPLWLFSVGSFADTKRLIIHKHRWPFWARMLFHAFGGRFGDHRDWMTFDAWPTGSRAPSPAGKRKTPPERGFLRSG